MKRILWLALIPVAVLAEKMPPESEQALAHDIYKEMVEINSAVTTGATTPVAQAVAARFRAAGFADSDIFLGGPVPGKWNVVVRYHGAANRSCCWRTPMWWKRRR